MKHTLTMNDICTILEIPFGNYGLTDRVSMDEANKRLTDFKKLIKVQQRNLVKLYHPDLPSSGKEEEEKMKRINAVVDMVNSLKVQRLEPVPQPFTIRFYGHAGTTGTWDNFTSTNSWR